MSAMIWSNAGRPKATLFSWSMRPSSSTVRTCPNSGLEKMAYSLFLEHEGTPLYPVVQEGVSLALERKGAPGTLKFTVLADESLDFEEGDRVHLSVDGIDMFYGYVFAKKSVSDGLISVTAYDQLRYLKNKDTFIGTGLKASELLKRLAEDFHLQTGTIEDTGHVIDIIDEQNQTLFDMIQNALDETLTNTGKLFVLYDDVGRLCLRNINQLKLDLVVDSKRQWHRSSRNSRLCGTVSLLFRTTSSF